MALLQIAMKTTTTIFVLLFLIWFLTGCALTVTSDGSRTWSLNGEEAMKAIIIYSEK